MRNHRGTKVCLSLAAILAMLFAYFQLKNSQAPAQVVALCPAQTKCKCQLNIPRKYWKGAVKSKNGSIRIVDAVIPWVDLSDIPEKIPKGRVEVSFHLEDLHYINAVRRHNEARHPPSESGITWLPDKSSGFFTGFDGTQVQISTRFKDMPVLSRPIEGGTLYLSFHPPPRSGAVPNQEFIKQRARDLDRKAMTVITNWQQAPHTCFNTEGFK